MRRIGLIVLALSLLGAVDRATIDCPVDGEVVEANILLSTNAALGHDRDLCPHAAGGFEGDEIRAGIAWCRVCGFSGTPQELERDVPEALAERVKKELAAAPPKTPWEAWAARAKILEWSGEPPARVGESWLRAAWAVRLEERPLPDKELDARAGELVGSYSQGAKDKILDPAKAIDASLGARKVEDRALAHYVSASLWRSRGELAHAEARYAKARDGAPPVLVSAIERDLATIALEREYLERALGRFRAALAEGAKVPEKQRALLAYLAAECARRTKNDEEAVRYYKMASKLAASDPQLPALVKQGLADTEKRKK